MRGSHSDRLLCNGRAAQQALALDHQRLGQQGMARAIKIGDKLLDAALILHDLLARLDPAFVAQNDAHARIEERKFAQAVLQRGVVVFDGSEDILGRLERDARARALTGIADRLQRRERDTILKAHEMFLAVAPNGQVQPRRQRIHDRHADAVQTAGDLVGILVEFSACMELGHDDLGPGNAFLGMDVDRNAAAIVFDRDRAVGVQDDETSSQ